MMYLAQVSMTLRSPFLTLLFVVERRIPAATNDSRAFGIQINRSLTKASSLGPPLLKKAQVALHKYSLT